MGAQTANPMAEYLLKLQLIISNTEFMNDEEAKKYETLETRLKGDEYVRAVTKTDMFESYQYEDFVVYNALASRGYEEDRIFMYIRNPFMIPKDVKNELLEGKRQEIINTYVEGNRYFASLTGKPFAGNDKVPADEIAIIPDGFYEIYKYDAVLMRDQPIHEMPLKYQELFMSSKYYQETLLKYPDLLYLRYLGNNSIPIEVSRKARDGDILRINTTKLSMHHEIFGNVTVESDIIHAYTNIYRSTRDYVYQTLRGDFSSIYTNYNDLIRYLTIYMSIGACLNEFQKKSSKMIYMNNVTANNLFVLYGLPSVIMEGEPMIEFLKKFRMLLMDKGTNYVYRVKDLIGYGNTDIYTLVMVKQQEFQNGKPVYDYSSGKAVPKFKVVFRRLGTADDNTSYFKFRDSRETYSLEEITGDDPRWWNTPEVEAILNDMNYTLSNSKYIQLSTHMSMSDVWWQSVIFLRGMMDCKKETQTTMLSISKEINNSSTISLYDAILSLIIMMHWQLIDFKGNAIPGNMYIPREGYTHCIDLLFDGFDESDKAVFKDGKPFKLASFNFDVRNTDNARYNAMCEYEYMDPAKFVPMVNKVLDREDANIGEVLMKDIRMIYDYILDKVRSATTIHDFRQASETYNLLFLVDPIRNWYNPDGKDPVTVICDRYNITENELTPLFSYFPREGTKELVNGVMVDVQPEIIISTYEDDYEYPIYLHSVLNNDCYNLKIHAYRKDDHSITKDTYPFKDPTFVQLFDNAVRLFNDPGIEATNMVKVVKDNYKQIIIDKANIDISNSPFGPTTFESLLMMDNVSLYDYLVNARDNNPDEVITMMRSIVAGLEAYTSSSLYALSCSVLGAEKYVSILKEVISYFKSYMVEFTRDEFRYIFGGILDNGGNSDMLNLIDEMASADVDISPVDSLSLFDVSHADAYFAMADDNIGHMYDEVLFRLEGLYSHIKQSGFQIWYDDGKRITLNPSFPIDDNENVVGNFVKRDNDYIIIINVNNIESKYPPGYYGNVL